MPDTDPQWKVLRCPHCDGLMKVDALRVPESLACPSCGDTFSDPGANLAEPSVEVAAGADDVVIRSSNAVPDPPDSDSDLGMELELDRDLGALPEIQPPKHLPETSIPIPKREEYKMPEMISNVRERSRAPGKPAAPAPKLDASRMGNVSDERFAPTEAEEGAVQVHVARKIAGWDMDEDKVDAGAGTSLVDQIKGRLGIVTIGLVCFLFVGLIGYGLIRSIGGEEVKPPRSTEKKEVEIAREALTSLERDTLDDSEKTFAEGGAVIEKFLNAKSYKERLAFVRDAERVGPLMEAYYKDNEVGVIDFRVPEDGWQLHPYETFLLGTVEREDFSKAAIAVERQEDGRFLVDWESFVGYCEFPWDKIVEEKPTETFLVRVKAAVGDYYNYGYTEDEWGCVRLSDEKTAHTIYGYVKLDDPVLDDMKKIMSRFGEVHVTLRLAHPGGNKAANQFLVKEVVSKGWVLGVGDKESGDGGEKPAEPGVDAE